MNDILSDFLSNGLSLDHVVLDGKIQRFPADTDDKKNSGWYLGYQNFTQKTGEVFYVVVYGNYRTGETFQYQSNVKLSPHDRKALKEQITKANQKEEEERKRVYEETAIEVSEKLGRTSKTGVSPYLQRKQISECPDLGVHYEFGGSIYVPCQDETGKVWSFQKIQADGGKFFFPGGRVSGCFHVLGDLESSRRIVLAEGLATAASIRLATGLPVVVAFNSGNLPAVANALRSLYAEKEFVVCGDDDCWKEGQKNSGRDKACEAAKQCGGKAIFPEFKVVDSKPTDWNDLHALEGLDTVKHQIEGVQVSPLFVLALGFKENEYFFTSSTNRQIVAISKFSEADFLHLMPVEYWEMLYPSSGQARVDWTSARSKMMDEARKKGIFQAMRVRGAGVWNDEGRVVVNMGDHLVVDGRTVGLGEIKSRYFYTLGSALRPLHPAPLAASDCDALVQACALFRWKKADFGFLMAGGLVCSRICGALPIRPHTWVTGGALTGKTTLLERLIKPILGESTLYVQGSTTEAGIRQMLKANAIPVLFDEFEKDGDKSTQNVASCIELMRSSWSDSSALIVKGGSSGNASAFQVKFSAIVSSIRTQLRNDADRSRFAIVELAPHGNDLSHWAELEKNLDKIDESYGDRLFARAIKMIPVLLANFKKLKRALAKKVNQRFGDQYGMLLAGYSILIQDDPITDAEAEMLASHVDLAEEKDEAKQTDHESALTHLLSKKISIDVRGQRLDFSVSEAIMQCQVEPDIKIGLQRVGIKIDLENMAVASVGHSELEAQIYRGTHWSKTWNGSLLRLPGATTINTRILGKQTRCTLIPLSVVDLKRY